MVERHAEDETVGRPMEILLIEDNLGDARLAIEALRDGGVKCRISLMRDGKEAMEFLFRRDIYVNAPRPDLILLDIFLPKMGGREVLTKIRADEELEHIPVVVLTASEVHEGILRAENLAIDAYMVKPVDLEQFLDVVRELRRFWMEGVILPVLD
jgi:CheY-like chemotaxis protein